MPDASEIRPLVKEYVNICNYALLEHKDSVALREVVALADRVMGTDDITLEIVDEGGEALAHFTTRYAGGQLAPIREGRQDPDRQIALPLAHVEEVVRNAGDYMAHPGKLDWEWLKVGLGALGR